MSPQLAWPLLLAGVAGIFILKIGNFFFAKACARVTINVIVAVGDTAAR